MDPRLHLLELRPVPALEAPAPLERAEPGQAIRLRPRVPFAIQRDVVGPDRIGLLVEVRDERALAELRAAGAEIGTVVGRIATVRAPLDAIPAIIRMSSLARIEVAAPLELHNDSAVSSSRTAGVRSAYGPELLGTTGRGVLVGIIDTGLDHGHPDFLAADGTPRTVLLWDQVTNEICNAARILAGACVSTDTQGHGTHVTGIAAGDGTPPGAPNPGPFTGVAPDAGILAVRFSFVSTARLVDGVAWMFEKADSIGQPAVVNISLGTHFGPHDGTSLFEQALDSLAGPGRIIIASAGNDGNAPNTAPPLPRWSIHAGTELPPGQDRTVQFRITSYQPTAGACNDFVLMDLWYDGAQDVTFRVRRPDGSSLSAVTGDTARQNHPGGQVLVLAPSDPFPGNGDRNALIQISDCGESGPPTPGTWQITFNAANAGTKPLDLWIPSYFLGGSGVPIGEAGFDDTRVVAMPATARNVIAVGGYTSRICWPTPTSTATCMGEVFGLRPNDVGDIVFFSSAGPSRDGRLKPEITAPAMMLMSSLSSRALQPPGQFMAPGREHFVQAGTSMSAPLVAGAVALLLQHAPTLTPDSVRAILAATAAQDPFTNFDYSTSTTGSPNFQWGHGKLDVRAALATLVDPDTPRQLWISVRSDTIPLGATLTIRGVVLNAFGDSLGPVTWGTSDAAVATVDADGTVTPLALGTALISADGSGLSESIFLHVVPPAVLAVGAAPLPAVVDRQSRAGTVIPLLDLRLVVDGFEGILVDTLGFELRGRDPAARFILVHDLDDDGTIHPSEPIIADTVLALGDDITILRLTPDLVIPAHDTVNLIVALELSGAVPHGAEFQAIFLPELTSSLNLRSGEQDRWTGPGTPVASAAATTTVLEPEEPFTLSENPIRSTARRLVLNFAEPPSLAAVYTLRGARVVDLIPRLDASGVRVDWDLSTDGGGTVAPGIYFLIVRMDGRLIRHRLIVARAFGGDDD